MSKTDMKINVMTSLLYEDVPEQVPVVRHHHFVVQPGKLDKHKAGSGLPACSDGWSDCAAFPARPYTPCCRS